MEPTEALRRVAVYCGMGTGVTGYYPPPSQKPKLPAAIVWWTGGQLTTLGTKQQWLIRGEIRLIVADQNEAEKVVAEGDGLVVKLIDRFRASRDNPARSLALDGEPGVVDHVHIGRGGADPLPFTASQEVPGWSGHFYGTVFPIEIKLTRDPEQIA